MHPSSLNDMTRDEVSIEELYKELLYKICLVGDGGVGKTAILQRFLGRSFQNLYQLTIGAEITVQKITIDNLELKFQIWDLAGQPRFQFVRSNFYRGSHAIIMVFDQTRPYTLRNLTKWKQEVASNVGFNVPYIILGNKNDLVTTNHQDDIEAIFEDPSFEFHLTNVPYITTSANTGENIHFTFETLGRMIRELNIKPHYPMLRVAT